MTTRFILTSNSIDSLVASEVLAIELNDGFADRSSNVLSSVGDIADDAIIQILTATQRTGITGALFKSTLNEIGVPSEAETTIISSGRNLVTEDNNKLYRVNTTSGTVQLVLGLGLTSFSTAYFYQEGANQFSVVGASGVTINGVDGGSAIATGNAAYIFIQKIAANIYKVGGDVT